MDPVIITWLWLVAGLLLIGGEVVLPGLVSIFLGIAAVLVAGLRFLGLVESLPASLGLWMVSSVALVLVFRNLAKKWLPNETSRENIDERTENYGKIVDVLADIDEESSEGRIRFQGTEWAARSVEGTLKKGDKARIVYNENLLWIVEAVEEVKELEADGREAVTVPAHRGESSTSGS